MYLKSQKYTIQINNWKILNIIVLDDEIWKSSSHLARSFFCVLYIFEKIHNFSQMSLET